MVQVRASSIEHAGVYLNCYLFAIITYIGKFVAKLFCRTLKNTGIRCVCPVLRFRDVTISRLQFQFPYGIIMPIAAISASSTGCLRGVRN